MTSTKEQPMSDTLQEEEDQIVKCECGRLGHSEQVRGLPKGMRVKAVTDIAQLGENVRTGTKGTVTGHCSDGRAIVFFEDHQYGHTFHTPNGYIEVDQNAWLECCQGYSHAPWCSLYASADRCPQCGGFNTSRGKTRLWCNDCQRHTWTYGSYEFTKEVPDQTATSEHQPAARSGGEEWRVAQRFDGVVLLVRAKSGNRETPLLTLSKSDDDYVMANRIVVEHNQHHSLVAERESYAQLLKAAKSLIAMNNCNYGRSAMRERGGFIELEKAVEAIEQRSTSE